MQNCPNRSIPSRRTAVLQAVEGQRTVGPRFCAKLQYRQFLQILLQPYGLDCACRQPGYAHERDDVLRFGAGKHPLEIDVRIAFLGDGERGAYLNGTGTQVKECPDLHRR